MILISARAWSESVFRGRGISRRQHAESQKGNRGEIHCMTGAVQRKQLVALLVMHQRRLHKGEKPLFGYLNINVCTAGGKEY